MKKIQIFDQNMTYPLAKTQIFPLFKFVIFIV